MIDLLNQKVIVRSNEDEPYKVGIFKGLEKTGPKLYPSYTPRVQVGEKDFFCMGVVIPYTEEMATFLDGLTPKRQWEILSDVSIAIQELRCRR